MLTTSRDGSVLTAVLDTPPANALGAEELHELKALVHRLGEDPDGVQVLLLCGSPRFFSGGVNIAMIAETAGREGGTDLVADLSSKLLRENLVEAGRVSFPAAVRHNYNLLFQAIRQDSAPVATEVPAPSPAPDPIKDPPPAVPAKETPAKEAAPAKPANEAPAPSTLEIKPYPPANR